MLNGGLPDPHGLSLFGLVAEGVSITRDALDRRLQKSFAKDEDVVCAKIVAFADEEGLEHLDDPAYVVVHGAGAGSPIPKQFAERHALQGKAQPALRVWQVDAREDTLLMMFDGRTYGDLFERMNSDEDGMLAIRGADGQLYMVPGNIEDCEMPGDLAEMVEMMPGASIPLIDTKNIPAGLLDDGRSETGAPIARATMTRATMARATMMQATMMRATMMRATMMRATMVTSDHGDER